MILAAALISTSDILPSAGGNESVDSHLAIAEPTPITRPDKKVREYSFIDGKFDGVKLVRSDDEWKRELSDEEFYILRQEGTEYPYSGALNSNKKKGTYHCAACGLAVFSSRTKYDSRTGWPSFYEPIHRQNIIEKEDRSLGEVRTEIECARCNSHLGHVFDDGPPVTGLRYCINAVSLRFKEANSK